MTVAADEANVLNKGEISSDTSASGDAGEVMIKASKLVVSNGGVISSATFAAGDAGGVTIEGGEVIPSVQVADSFVISLIC